MHFSKGDHYKHKYPQNSSSSSSSTLYFPPIPPLSVNHLPFPNDEPFPQQSFMARSPRRSNLPLIDTNPNRDNLLHSSIDNHLNQGSSSIISLRPPPRPPSLQLNEESLIMMENQQPSSSTSTFPNLVPPLSIHSTGEMNQHSDLNQQPPVSARSIRFNLDPIIHEEEESKRPHKKKPRENKPRVPSVSFPSNPITMPQDEDQFEIDPTQKERIARRPKTPRTPELALNSDYVSRDWTRGGEEESKESEQEKERQEVTQKQEKITSSLSLARFLKRKSNDSRTPGQSYSRQNSTVSDVQPNQVGSNERNAKSTSISSSKELKALKQKEKERLAQEKLQAKIDKIKREMGTLSSPPQPQGFQQEFPEYDQFINPQHDIYSNGNNSLSNLRSSTQHLKPLPSIPSTHNSGKIQFMARYFKDQFKKDSTNPLTVNRSLSEEFKKVPYLTILLSIVQILMFVVSIAIGGLESVIVNPFIGPPEDTMILMGAKKGQLIISPNWQVYRLVTPVFLHGGIVHLCLNLLWQLTVMLPLEKHWGILYVGFIYFMSALGGNLLSALFLPHITTIGASSALFGILGAIYADLWMNWRFMPQPKKDFVLLTFQVVAQIIVGLIPWIDNFAHCGGLLVGFLTTLLTIPRMRDLNPYEESINGGSVNTQVKRKKLSGASNHLSNDPNSQLETIDLESGSSQTKSHTQSAILRFMKKFACGCSACFCCCFYCFTKKGRAKGKFRLWLRVIAGCLLFLYFAVFGGLYFSQLDFNCKWCYFINPDWDTLYEIFELAREKL